MSILIKGMEMPTPEQGVRTINIYADGVITNFAEEIIGHADPIPEKHGRLIDADVMVEGLMKCAKNPPDDDQESRWFYLFAAEIAKSCETIEAARMATKEELFAAVRLIHKHCVSLKFGCCGCPLNDWCDQEYGNRGDAELTGECDMVWVRCSNEDCWCQMVTRFDEPEEAIEEWNRRDDNA